mmetsp:Transcript_78964/g.189577  ORF Transcript_78964/g.189577 Transcript_78964/m.189577 type:complete len:242 (+) Transcript_78964:493-1218(+)
MECRKVEVHIGIPHDISQSHRDERHHAAQQHLAAHLILLFTGKCSRARVADLLREGLILLCRLVRLAREESEFHELQGYETRLGESGRNLFQNIAQHRRCSIVADEFKLLQDDEVHQRGQRRHVRIASGWRVVGETFDQVAFVLEVVGMPSQAKLEIDFVDSLSCHLRFHRVCLNPPAESLPDLRLNEPRLLREVGVAAQRLSDLTRLPESLAQDVLVVEATMQMLRDQAQGDFPVFLQVP